MEKSKERSIIRDAIRALFIGIIACLIFANLEFKVTLEKEKFSLLDTAHKTFKTSKTLIKLAGML